MTDAPALQLQGLEPLPLPPSIRSRRIPDVNGLEMHVLEAGDPSHPTLLLLHGFPELAFSWRDVMPALAAEGYYVVAPDQRGYGRTVGWDDRYEGDLAPFRQINLVADMVALLAGLGVTSVTGIVGHDFGAVVAAWAALLRPDIFTKVVLMSAPFAGPPDAKGRGPTAATLDAGLAALTPARRHYTHFFTLPYADADMRFAPQGLTQFLRNYFYVKSGDAPGDLPNALSGATPAAFAMLPTYYVMRREAGMAETVAASTSRRTKSELCRWLPDAHLEVYSREFARTGFQGGLNWYRAASDPALRAFSGRAIDVPAAYIAGARDWGVRQTPGAFEAMNGKGCRRLEMCDLVPGAGHWVQQEAAEAVVEKLLAFLKSKD
jgi:pimeloyl-ACP methyl ester carboxylesterase